MIAVELEDSDPKETNLTSSHSAMEDSRAFDSEGAAKQTCPSPTTVSESECEEVNLKSCLDVHYEKRDGVHGVLVHDKKGEQKWTPVCTTKEESKAQQRSIAGHFLLIAAHHHHLPLKLAQATRMFH